MKLKDELESMSDKTVSRTVKEIGIVAWLFVLSGLGTAITSLVLLVVSADFTIGDSVTLLLAAFILTVFGIIGFERQHAAKREQDRRK